MTFIYCLIRLISFPGVYARCFWEQVVCRACRVPIEDNRCLREGENCGHIEHELMPTPAAAFAMCFIPAFFNLFGAIMLLIIPVNLIFIYEIKQIYVIVACVISLWLGFSLFLNSFAAVEDALNMTEMISKKGNIFEKIILSPFAAILYVFSLLEKYSVTFLTVVAAIAAMLICF